ncbi:MAG TPA: YggT family protein [Eubacteriaceae bacterium]|nr:YggT family protein [Eubacteriaceae bacterium]
MTPLNYTLLRAGNIFFQLIYYLIFIRVILSWIRPNPRNQIVMLLYNLTDPILEPFRMLTYKLNIGGMIDFSPLIAILAIQFIIHPLYNRLIFLIF